MKREGRGGVTIALRLGDHSKHNTQNTTRDRRCKMPCMMRRCKLNDDARNKNNTRQKRYRRGNLLEHRSRAVTTLLHYKRISPRDPRMNGGEDEKEQEVKFSCFFDKRVKPTILEGCKEMRTDMRKKQEFTENFGSTSVGKWDKQFDKKEELDKIWTISYTKRIH